MQAGCEFPQDLCIDLTRCNDLGIGNLHGSKLRGGRRAEPLQSLFLGFKGLLLGRLLFTVFRLAVFSFFCLWRLVLLLEKKNTSSSLALAVRQIHPHSFVHCEIEPEIFGF